MMNKAQFLNDLVIPDKEELKLSLSALVRTISDRVYPIPEPLCIYLRRCFGEESAISEFISAYNKHQPTLIYSLEQLQLATAEGLVSLLEPPLQTRLKLMQGKLNIVKHREHLKLVIAYLHNIPKCRQIEPARAALDQFINKYGGMDKTKNNKQGTTTLCCMFTRHYYAEALMFLHENFDLVAEFHEIKIQLSKLILQLTQNINAEVNRQDNSNNIPSSESESKEADEKRLLSASQLISKETTADYHFPEFLKLLDQSSKLASECDMKSRNLIFAHALFVTSMFKTFFEPSEPNLLAELNRLRNSSVSVEGDSQLLKYNKMDGLSDQQYLLHWEQLGSHLDSLAKAESTEQIETRKQALLRRIAQWKEAVEFKKSSHERNERNYMQIFVPIEGHIARENAPNKLKELILQNSRFIKDGVLTQEAEKYFTYGYTSTISLEESGVLQRQNISVLTLSLPLPTYFRLTLHSNRVGIHQLIEGELSDINIRQISYHENAPVYRAMRMA